eukprot:gene1670-439_t
MERVKESGSDPDSPFKPLSHRLNVFMIVFIVTNFLLALTYAGFIALYWGIHGTVFQWIVVLDIIAAICLIVNGIVGIVSVVTYLIPIVRFIVSCLFLIVTIINFIVFVVTTIVMRSSFNFHLQTDQIGAAVGLNVAIMVVGAFCVVLSFIPCFCISIYQAIIAFFIWREKNKYVTPGFLLWPSTIVLRAFRFAESNSIDIIKNSLCKKK